MLKNEDIQINVGDIVLVDARGIEDSFGKSLLKSHHPVCVVNVNGAKFCGLLMGSSPRQHNNPQRPNNIPIYKSYGGYVVKPTSYVEADHLIICDTDWIYEKLGKVGPDDFANVVDAYYKLKSSEICVMEHVI